LRIEQRQRQRHGIVDTGVDIQNHLARHELLLILQGTGEVHSAILRVMLSGNKLPLRM
jgi:hypothetical protein